jgi:hypothetical protein
MNACRDSARGVVVGRELDLNEAKTQKGESKKKFLHSVHVLVRQEKSVHTLLPCVI